MSLVMEGPLGPAGSRAGLARPRARRSQALVLLEGVQVLVDLSMEVLGDHADVGEQGPQHVKLLAQQLDPLL